MKKKQKGLLAVFFTSVTIIVILFCWFISPFYAIRNASEKDVELIINSGQNKIVKSTTLFFPIQITLKNIGNDNVKIYTDFTMAGLLEFKIITPTNLTICPEHVPYSLKEKFEVLKPNEIKTTEIDIFQYEYYMEGNKENAYSWSETGYYKIQFLYDIGYTYSDEIVFSNIQIINVII